MNNAHLATKLRRPNFHHATPLSTSHGGGGGTGSTVVNRGGSKRGGIGSAAEDATQSSSVQQLANYTRQRHRQLLTARGDAALDENEEGRAQSIIGSVATNNNSTKNAATSSEQGSNDAKKKKNDPTMEQCIILLEPSLKIFRDGCIKADKSRAKKKKKRTKKCNDSNNTEGEDDDQQQQQQQQDDDEVPPQLLRSARFFHFRWLPMKKALLRPPPPSHLFDDGSDDDDAEEARSVEVGIHHRLRLAKACWKRGLVAAAEYESLKSAFDSRETKKRENNDDYDEFGKRHKTNGSDEGGNLMERARLSLMRLPTDAIQPERSVAAWRHVKAMILECCTHWESKTRKPQHEQDRRHNFNNRERSPKDGGENALDALAPEQVAEWAMTSWTALLLSRGMDSNTSTTSVTNNANHHHRSSGNNMASVEHHLATMLSNRSFSNNPTFPLAKAVASRIDDLLLPSNLTRLNGVHLYSLGKLLASFHLREDAEMHIITSVVKCCCVAGMMGLEQLSRLLAVYSCCISTAVMTSNEYDDSEGNNNSRKTPAKDLERRLFAMLNDNEVVKKVTSEEGSSTHEKKQIPTNIKEVTYKAKSFLEAVLGATAHLVKCSK